MSQKKEQKTAEKPLKKVYEFGNFTFEPENYLIKKGGAIPVNDKNYSIFLEIIKNK